MEGDGAISSWFLGDCAVLQVDDRCKTLRLALRRCATEKESPFRCDSSMHSCVSVCARVRVCAGANEIGGNTLRSGRLFRQELCGFLIFSRSRSLATGRGILAEVSASLAYLFRDRLVRCA